MPVPPLDVAAVNATLSPLPPLFFLLLVCAMRVCLCMPLCGAHRARFPNTKPTFAEGTAVFAYTSTAVYAWGAAWLRGDETGDNVLTPILLFEAAPGTRIVHVDAGVRCSVVVTDDGMLFTHGAVAFGAAQPAGGSGDVYLGRPVRVAELADRDVVYAKCVAYSKVSPYVVTRDGCVLCPDREAESDHSLPWRDDVDLSANLLVSLGLSSSSTATILSLFADDGDGDGER